MVGGNVLVINQATMLEAINLWLGDQFKKPPKAENVRGLSDKGFEIKISAPPDKEP